MKNIVLTSSRLIKISTHRGEKFNSKVFSVLVICLSIFLKLSVIAQTYPPETKLIFKKLSTGIPRPAYLDPFIDPTFGTEVTRIGDKIKFGSAKPYHHYAKDQPWNSDGSLIMMDGWPAQILDGNTYMRIRTISPSGDHHVWSNTNPEIIYGASGNKFESQSAITGTKTTLHTFTQYTTISIGDWEGNISNDDKYAALRCAKAGINYIVVYDIPDDSIVATMNIGSIVPNNVTMSQSGKYVAIQWNVDGTGSKEGITIHNSSDLSFVRQVSPRGGTHYDLGYDTKGNEVSVQQGETRGYDAVRLDNGEVIHVTTDSQMSWPMHISCRNLNRPGWMYTTEFAASYDEPSKPNYQLIFAVKIDGSGTINAFAHVHHSDVEDYDRSPFGVPNRDGTRVMWRSDWDNGTGDVNSYVATMLPDSEAPSVPGGLVASALSSSGFTLTWSASTDNILMKYYEVFVDGVSKGKTSGLTFIISNLTEFKSYSVTVRALDFTGNISAQSEVLLVAITPPVSVNPANLTHEKFTATIASDPNRDNASLIINSEDKDDFTIWIYDITGRKVFEKNIYKTRGEPMELLSFNNKSLYILKVANSKNQVVTRKFIN